MNPSKHCEARIIKAGPNCTLQDLGRSGGQHLGYASGGASDEHAFRWANKLLGNTQNCASLEITLGQFEIEFNHACTICVTGAKANICLNNLPIKMWRTQYVKPGSRLKIALPHSGLLNYLAIKGGFNGNAFLNSLSTVLREKTGPNNGLSYGNSSVVSYSSGIHKLNLQRELPRQFIPDYKQSLTLKLFLNENECIFTFRELDALLSHEFIIDMRSNKMGYRLNKPTTSSSTTSGQSNSQSAKMTSEGIAFGAVQMPPDGHPIILLKDRQTIGGYPKIGCISRLSAFRLSQRRPGQQVYFIPADLDQESQNTYDFLTFFEDE